MKTFLIAVALTGLTVTAYGQQPMPSPRELTPYPETVTVSGTARTSVTPDRFSFTAGVQTVAATVDEAVTENNAKVAAVIAALRRAGAGEKDIRTSSFGIHPQQDYTQGRMPRILGYQVSNNVTVTRTNVGEAGKLLQAAIAAGVNTSSGLNFEVSDPTRGRDEGLRNAFEDARSKAALLAKASGRTLGRAIQISEGAQMVPNPPFPPGVMRAQAMSADSPVPVESGVQELSFTVSAVFELR